VRFLAILFSIYILVLAGFPCISKDDCSRSKSTTEQTKNCCSPFFACNTCTGFTLTKTNLNVAIPAIPRNRENSLYRFSLKSAFYYAIWQPPKSANVYELA
jgi:hypothetical protein